MVRNRYGIEPEDHLRLRAHALWKQGLPIPRHLEKEMEDLGLDVSIEYARWHNPQPNLIKETI